MKLTIEVSDEIYNAMRKTSIHSKKSIQNIVIDILRGYYLTRKD